MRGGRKRDVRMNKCALTRMHEYRHTLNDTQVTQTNGQTHVPMYAPHKAIKVAHMNTHLNARTCGGATGDGAPEQS